MEAVLGRENSGREYGDRVSKIKSDLVFWTIVDGALVITILCGNTLTILAIRYSRRLRSAISNLFVLSLAISDIVVGFTLPYHLAFYVGSSLGKVNWCLLRFFLIILACCTSIWNLIAIAVDRYIAIIYPLHYSRYMTKKVALFLCSIGWMLGILIATVPLFWNNWDSANECEFDEILKPWYMAGVITPVFSMVWLCLLIVYSRIYREASRQIKQMRSSVSNLNQMPSDWKSVQVVLLILGCFSICWLPYFAIATSQIFRMLNHSSATLYKGAFSLAMANSGMNPLIYAWKNRNFRKAFGNLLRCKNPDAITPNENNNTAVKCRKASVCDQETPPAIETPHIPEQVDEEDAEIHNKSARSSYDAQSSDTVTTHLSKFSTSIASTSVS
uniref:G-protein coupled receptors family 1 profile domain-containing protein n=1 Tax=Lutzomyia longipalpis TaxID=7200 RepID=A0A1B0GHV7_LUTLO